LATATITVPYLAGQTAGNLNVVVVNWNDTTAQVQTVSDSAGNTYQRAIGPTTRSTSASQSLYYAINRATTTGNAVTVTFTTAATAPELRVAEYSGVDPLQPLDVAVGGSGNSSTSSSGSVTTRNANDLLVGANWATGVTTGPGSPFTQRLITTPGDILEDRVVAAAGSYSATAPTSPSGGWIMHLAAFRAGGSPQPDLTVTKTHAGSFNQGQTGATYTLTVTNTGAWTTVGAVTVTDALPSDLTATGLSGTGWSCTLSTLTCTRSTALAPGASYPAITLTVTVSAAAPASVTNTATVSGGGEVNTSNDIASDPTTINVVVPDLTIAKSHSGTFKQRQTGATYTITVRNSGTGPTAGTVTVVDTLPAGLTATGLSGTGWNCTLSMLRCTRSTALAPGSSFSTITLTVTVASDAPATVSNIATVSGGGEVNTANDTASDVTTITPVAPDLTLTKSHTGTFTQGQSGASYTLTVTNAGNASTSGTVTVADTLPAGLTAAAMTGTGWTCVVSTATCTQTTALAAGSSYASISLTVNVAATAPPSVTNVAAVSGGGETNAANNTATDVTAIVQIPDLTLTKTHSGSFRPGGADGIYAISVANVGTGSTSGAVTVTDTLPAGLSAAAMSGAGWTCVLSTVSCSRTDTLAAGASYPAIALTVNIALNAPSSVTNRASVAGGSEVNTSNDVALDATPIAVLADLVVSSTHAATFVQGQSGTYTISVQNIGGGTTTAPVTLADGLPAGLSASNISGFGWTCDPAAVACGRADPLAPGASYPPVTLVVNVAPDAPASVTNSVTVGGGGETNLANDTASDPTLVALPPDLVVTSTHVGTFTQGQINAGYVLTISNIGSTPVAGTVIVVDTLPAGLTATTMAGDGWICVPDMLTCTRSDGLAAGASYPAIALTVAVASDASTTVTNVVAVSGGGEVNTANDAASDVTSVVAAPDLVVTKTHAGAFSQGQTGAVYTLIVSNAGAGPTSGLVAVLDTLPVGLTATTLAGAGWNCVPATMTCTRGDVLAAGASYPGITLTVNVAMTAAPLLANSASVSGGGELNAGNNTAVDPTTITQLPDLTLRLSHAGSFTQGQAGDYTLTVRNDGAGSSSGSVSVTDALPAGLIAGTIGGDGWTCTLTPLACTRPDPLAPGTSYPAITLHVDVAGNAPATVTNTATVGGGGEANTANDAATDPTAIVQLPDLVLTLSHSGAFVQGQSGAMYTLSATNTGAGPSTAAVAVVDMLPAGLTATAMTGAGWSCALATLTCMRADLLQAGASYPPITLTVDVSPWAATSITNAASVSGGGETNMANDAVSDATTIQLPPDLTLSKTHAGDFTQGQNGAAYNVVVSNVGNGPTAGTVTVVDTLPAGLTATAITGAGWTCTLGTLTCSRGDTLAAGSSYPGITVTVNVSTSAPATLTNTASVNGAGETNVANNGAADATTVTQIPDLALALTHGGSFVQGQTGASYALTVSNHGSGSTTGVVSVAAVIPAGLTVTAMSGSGWTCAVATMSCMRSDVLAALASYPDITVLVDVANNAPAGVTVTASVSGGGDTNTANNTASDATTITQLPDLIVHVAHSGTFVQGRTGGAYLLTVSNIGAAPAAGGVTISDALPAGLSASAMSGTGWTCAIDTVTCTRADALAAGGSYPAVTLTVAVAADAPASVTDVATVGGGGETNTANDAGSDVTPIQPPADLTLTLSHAGSFTQGQTGASYVLTVANLGTGPTSGAVTVVDTLPAGLSATAMAGAGWSCALNTLTCTRGDALGAGASYPDVSLTVAVADTAPASVINTAVVSGGGELATGNDAASDPTPILQLPDLTVGLTHTGSVAQGQHGAVYTLTVSNVGPGPTTGVVSVADTLPSDLTATAVTGTGWTCTLVPLTCTRSDALASNASYPAVSITFDVSNSAPASVTDVATVSGGGDRNAANNTVSDSAPILQLPDLTLTLTHVGPLLLGQSGATYTLLVRNVGFAPTDGSLITVADQLPAGLTATAIAGAGWTCAVGSLSCTRSDSLPAGSSYPTITVTVNIAPDAAATVTNAATVGGGGETNTANDSATDSTVLQPPPDLRVAKSHSGSFTQGQTGAAYTLTVTNAGTGPTLSAVTLTDAMPAGLTATAMAGAGWTCALATLTCTRSDVLAAGAGFPIVTVTVNVSAAAPATLTNVATVSGGGELQTANDSATDPTTVTPVADLVLTKSHAGTFTQGQTGAAYTLIVSNNGAGPSTGPVTVTDSLPSGLTATALSGPGWSCLMASLACTRSDALQATASYPPVTLTVNVGATAPATVTNSAIVSGGGELNTSNNAASDMTPVTQVTVSPPVVVAEAHFAVDRTTAVANRADLSLNVSGTNTALFVAFHSEFDGGDTNWSVQDNGVPGTLLVNTDGYTGGAGNQRFRIYYWLNPPVGANAIVVQNSYVGSNQLAVSAVLLSNVQQTAPLGPVALDVSTTARTSEAETVATATSDLVLHVIADALFIRGTLGAGETSISVANDGLQKSSSGDGDASLWIATKLASSATTTVSSSGWANAPPPAPRVLNGVGIAVHGAALVGDTQSPSTPTGLVGTAISVSQINLSWSVSTDDVGVTGYRIFRNSILVGVSTTTSFADAGLTASTTYSYTVAALDAANNVSTQSAALPVTTLAPVTNLRADIYVDLLGSSQGQTLTASILATGTIGTSSGWDVSPSPLRAMSVAPHHQSLLTGVTVNGTTYPTTHASQSMAFDHSYDYSYALLNVPSGHAMCTVAGWIVFGPPNVGTASSVFDLVSIKNLSGHFLILQLNNGNSNSAGVYAVHAHSDGNGSLVSADIVITPGSTYWFSLHADYLGGTGTLSVFDTLGRQVGSTQTIKQQTGGGCGWVQIGNNEVGKAAGYSSYFENILVDYTTAVFPLGPGAPPPDTAAPSLPASLVATPVSASQINLSWTASTDNVGVIGYRVLRSGLQVGTTATSAFTDTGLQPNTSYSYTVSAYDAAGNVSPLSQPASAMTLAPDTTPPSVPTNLVASNVTSVSATISWTASTDDVAVVGYRVMRNGTLIGTSTQNSYNDTALAASTTYVYAAAAFDGSGNLSVPSQALSITTTARPLAFVKLKEARATVSSNSISTGAFASAVSTGNLMVVWVWYSGSSQSVAAVTDTAGNTYAKAVGPTTGTGTQAAHRQELWYAKNIVGATGLSVTATFGNTFSTEKSITAHEYSGADPVSPLDVTSFAATSSANASSGAATTTAANELIFGAGLFSGTGTAGTGFTQRSSIVGNASEDKVVVAAGSNSATFANTAQDAILQMATFKAASAAPSGGSMSSMVADQSISSTGDLAVIPGTVVLTPATDQIFTTNGSAGVTWAVDGVPGGSSASGTISAGGLYVPAAAAGTHTVTATNVDLVQSATATVYVTTYAGAFTHHNDNFRTGRNAEETVLAPANVRASTFGKLFTYPLDGAAFASPLYVAGVTVPGQGTHNVVYVATEHDSVYAFDADGRRASPLWQRSFLGPERTPVPAADTGDCCGLGAEIGITGTPVVDVATGTLYVVAKTKESAGGVTGYVQRLHALDIGSGAEKFGGPVMIQASAPGQGSGAVAGQVAFDSLHANQRAALLLNQGVVYIAFGAHGPAQTTHGWVLGYDAATLRPVLTVNLSPNADGAGIWQANGGPAADLTGNVFVITGNGAFDVSTSVSDFGDSFVKIAANGTIADYFTPWNQGALNANGLDLGSAGPLLLPDQPGAHPHLLVSAGKNGTIYLVDRDAMGRFSGTTSDLQIVQSIADVFPNGTPEPGNVSAPIYFNGTVYFGPVADSIQAFPMENGRLGASAHTRSVDVFPYPGAQLSVSASGVTNGIVWAIQRNGDCGVAATCASAAAGVLKAYDAANLGTLLYSSDQIPERDTLDPAAKFSVPLVANGKVFVTSSSQLTIYGLLP